MKKVLSIRTKAEVIMVAALLLGIGVSSVMSVTRTITDSSDTIETYIKNSNGNYWSATGANIQVAINDCDNVSGSWVKLTGANYSLTSGINLWYNVSLDTKGSIFFPNGNYTIFTVYPASEITSSSTECIIDVTGVGEYNTSVIVVVPYQSTAPTPFFRQSIIYSHKRTSVKHVSIVSDNQQGTGLYLHVDANNENIGAMIFDDIYLKDLYRGIYLCNDDANGFINANYFSHIFTYKVMYAIYLEEIQNEISGNMFVDINVQPSASTVDYHAITMDGNCNFNTFTNLIIWDWQGLADVTESIYTSGEADFNYFHGVGFSDQLNTYFEEHTRTNTYFGATGSRLFVFELNATYINRFAASDTNGGVRFYAGTDENPYTYFYGDKSGTAKYVAHRVDATGNWDFITQAGGISLEPSDKIVYIKDMLDFTVTTSAPATSDGRIAYADGTGWDPGSGEGFYGFFDGAWNDISTENVSLHPFYDQATPPTLAENTTAYWYNTTGSWLYQIANTYGTQYYVNMSKTY